MHALLLLLSLCQPTPAPFNTDLITVGDGVSSKGTFNGSTEAPFIMALQALKVGGVIEVLGGHWRFTRAVPIKKDGITIRGSAASRFQPTKAGAVGLFRVEADHVRISGIHVKVINAHQNQSCILGLGDSIAVDHCTFTALDGAPGFRMLEFGDGVTTRRGTLIESNSFIFSDLSAGVIGVTLRNGVELRMANNEFRKQGAGSGLCRYAVEIRDESKGTITGNSFQNLGAGGSGMLDAVIYSNADTEGHHFAIAGNFFENCHTPQVLHLAGGRFCTITGNVFGRMILASNGVIRLGASETGKIGESNVISGNQFHNVTLGVNVNDNLWNNINGNQFTICTSTQITVGNTAQGVVITSNQFVGSTALNANIPHAIQISFTGDHLVHDNVCSSQHLTFKWSNVVSSQSTDASILDNYNS